jgi:polyketide biosynthesis acyl carrier protein
MNRDTIFSIIVNNTREVIPELVSHTFNDSDQLSELGANSIDRADIVIMTLESLALRIPLVAVAKAGNLGELADLLYEQLQSG